MTKFIENSFEKKKFIGVALIDFTVETDTISHKILVAQELDKRE
jgi:hypothetical protein